MSKQFEFQRNCLDFSGVAEVNNPNDKWELSHIQYHRKLFSLWESSCELLEVRDTRLNIIKLYIIFWGLWRNSRWWNGVKCRYFHTNLCSSDWERLHNILVCSGHSWSQKCRKDRPNIRQFVHRSCQVSTGRCCRCSHRGGTSLRSAPDIHGSCRSIRCIWDLEGNALWDYLLHVCNWNNKCHVVVQYRKN